ncbi:MAG: ABC transporter ATP-binding protein [Myxococcales bacterium]|nr:ABC transporter ATP-binding protein [Myxococcales bacterium]
MTIPLDSRPTAPPDPRFDPSAPLLEARGLAKRFAGKPVVDGLDLTCRRGSVLGLLGPNGAGKTTTLRMLYGFLDPDVGTIRYGGLDLSSHRDLVKRRIGVVTQDDTLDSDLDVLANLEVYATYFRPRPANVADRIGRLLDQFGLREHAAKSPQQLSGGFKRRALIARALVHSPDVLFLDEPTTGLDPAARVEVWQLVDRLRADGLGIILTTHYMDEAEKLSDEVLVMSQGKAVAHGVPRQLLGEVLGEHVAVVPDGPLARERVRAWTGERDRVGERDLVGGAERTGAAPACILSEWHVPVKAADLAALTLALDGVPFELRRATLEDLFLLLQRQQDARGAAVVPP